MFGPITIPYECVMLYNTARLKYNVEFDDVEMAIAEMCSHVKETYEDFIAGQAKIKIKNTNSIIYPVHYRVMYLRKKLKLK